MSWSFFKCVDLFRYMSCKVKKRMSFLVIENLSINLFLSLFSDWCVIGCDI